MIRYGGIFILSALLSFLITPLVKKFAININAIDVPKDDRRIHKTPIPRMGGLAIFLSFVISALCFSRFNKSVIGIVLGSLLLVIGGMIDDIRPVKPLQKLAFQVLAAFLLIAFGINVSCITVPFLPGDGYIYIGYFGIPITILWVVGITNAINLIDGLDGLACGICFISSLTLFGVSLISGRYIAVLLTAALAGSCIGFLPYNFNPAKIFMGDTGSQFLGFALAAISIQGAIKSAAAVVVAVPILALGIPIYDTLFAMIRRKINNKPIMEADRGHLHHRLLDMGFSQRQVVFIMYSISVILGTTALLAMMLTAKKSFALLIVVCSITLAFGIEIGLFSRKSKN
ncbi:undecaprenyl/decaprenyl-phosphate alpha-N-acetylglucosaminyl 1-phosphate transferase [Caloramator sp. E03]|uniref:glycosyltransferase family 4 protein n=1 Tax=Caloramator sp. E03 TaxID=2576307 RepID=UPI0011102382|nr:MraY family glycosyltransferase [Caloramator sp. E03]QCX33380.1 undecaprenyl/decaprenyl-phosphate alpha-N-acetylglucosaminyl 1-phosphate transferase [Caloramator sp. E03]